MGGFAAPGREGIGMHDYEDRMPTQTDMFWNGLVEYLPFAAFAVPYLFVVGCLAWLGWTAGDRGMYLMAGFVGVFFAPLLFAVWQET